MTLTAEYLRDILIYDIVYGDFVWKFREDVPASWNTKYAGKIAGSLDAQGYWVIRINNGHYKAHRLAWTYITGEDIPKEIEIDHKNGKRSENDFFNLRKADDVQNAVNAGIRKDNKSGYKGVSWHRRSGKWQAQINDNGIRKSLGYFDLPEEASQTYQIRAREMHGEFVRKIV